MDAAAAYISEQWPRSVWSANWLASYDKLLDGAPSLTWRFWRLRVARRPWRWVRFGGRR